MKHYNAVDHSTYARASQPIQLSFVRSPSQAHPPASLTQVRDRAAIYLQQLHGAAGGPEAVNPTLDVSLANLESSLKAYLGGAAEQPFDLSTVPKAPVAEKEKAKDKPAAVVAGISAEFSKRKAQDEAAERLAAVPQLFTLGKLFRSGGWEPEGRRWGLRGAGRGGRRALWMDFFWRRAHTFKIAANLFCMWAGVVGTQV